jgi:sigma-B regulation protein RsbU (phosphoserine phosphatase)
MSHFSTEDLDSAPCGFLTFADNGIISSLNTTLLQLLGYEKKSEIVGKSIETLFSIAGRIFYQTHFFPLIKLHGRASEIFFSLKTRDSDGLPVMCNAIRKETTGGQASVHCIIVPVTERSKYEQELLLARRQAEEALEKNDMLTAAKKELEIHTIELDRQLSRLTQINDDISQFSKVISHDLQEPIRKIAVLADKVSIESRDKLSYREILELEKINNECIRLRSLVTDLEHFISLNIAMENFSGADLNQVVRQAFSRATTGSANVSLSAGPLPVIDGYDRQLELLFYILFEHSVRHHSDAAPLTITIDCTIVQQNSFRTIKGRYRYIDFAKITIADTGNGFHDLDNEHIFRFARKSDGVPMDFGLAFCKKIADNHYGNISTTPVREGGVAVTVLLPVTQLAQA